MPASGRPITPRDLLRYRLLEDQALSPDADQVAYTLATIESDDHRYQSAIWLIPTAGGEPRRLTHGDKGDSSPRWRPDGNALAFRSDRGNESQVYVLDLAGGEPHAVTSLGAGISDFAWSPNGRALVVVSPGDEKPDPKPATRRVTRLHYKGDGVGLLPDLHSHLWLIDLTGGDPPRQLTNTDEDDSNPAWSPDGTRIAFNRTRPSAGGSAPFSDIWVLDVASGEERNLTDGRGPCFGPRWSPDGATLAFAGHTDPGDIWFGKDYGIWTIPAFGGDAKEVTAGFAFTAARAVFGDPWRGMPWPSAHWNAAGTELYFLATVGGTVHLHAVPARGGEVRQLTDGRAVITDLSVAGDGIVYGRMSSTEPTDLWHLTKAGDDPERLTNLNGGPLQGLTIVEAELIRFDSHDGTPIEGWLIPPAGLRSQRTASIPAGPLIHGGPTAPTARRINHAFQTLPARATSCSTSTRAAARATARSSPGRASATGASATIRT